MLIIVLIFLIILIVGIVVIINTIKKNDVYHEDIPLEEDVQKKESNMGKFQKLDNISDYYTVKACLGKFINAYYSLFENNDELERKNLYQLLDNKYINYKNITEENIYDKLTKYEQSIITINSILSLNNYNGIYVYLVNYISRNSITNINETFNIMLILDKNNMTYSVILDDYLQENQLLNYSIGDSIDFEVPNKIDKNNNNYFGYLSVTYDEYAEDLYDQFRLDLIYNVDRAYERLNEEFKRNYYPTIDDFKNFISDNYKDIYISKYGTYTNIMKDGQEIYKCIDSNAKFYVTFNLSAPMEYSYEFEMK